MDEQVISPMQNADAPQGDERKEVFGAQSDEKNLAQIKMWERESETVYDKLKRIWTDNENYYHGNQTELDMIRGRKSKAVENRVFMGVETMIPIATARLPGIVVNPGDDSEQAQMDAEALQDVLAYHFERVNIQQKAERWMRHLILKRYAVWKVKWDITTDDVDVVTVDPKRVRIPKFGTTVEELAFIMEDLEMSYDYCVTFYGKAKADELLKTTPKDSEQKVRKATFSIKEVWTNEWVVWATDSIVLKKMQNPYFNFDLPEANFFRAPRKPYDIKSIFETDESMIGDTDYVQQTKSIQDNLNVRKRQIENITNKVANPNLLIDSDVMSEEQASAITDEPGQILYGKDAASGTKIRYEAPGQVPQYLFSDLDITRQAFDNIWGVHATTRGEREGRETLGGRQLLREGDLGRIDLLGRQLERSLDAVAELWTQMIKLFYTEEKSFSILGEDGIRFVRNFSGAQVGANVRPMVKPGSTLKQDEFAMQQLALMLWQNKAIGIRTLYTMIRLPNKLEAIQDWIDTTTGAILGLPQPAVDETGKPIQTQPNGQEEQSPQDAAGIPQ